MVENAKHRRAIRLMALLLICALSSVSLTIAQTVDSCPATAPADAPALLTAAEACLEGLGPFYERNSAQALAYAEAAAAGLDDPADLAHALDLQAEAHFWLGNLGQAIARQTQALLRLPTADRYLMRAAFMDRVGDTAGAIADAEQAILLAPEQLDLYLWLGRYALDHGDDALALDVAERAAAFAPDDVEVMLLQADAHYARADYAAAKAVYERYMTLADSLSPVVVARLAVIERRLGN